MRSLAWLTAMVLGLAAGAIAQDKADGAPDAAPDGDGVAVLIDILGESDDAGLQLDVLKGINAAMEGRRKVTPPAKWAVVRGQLLGSANRDVRMQAQSLAVVFGDTAAFDVMRKTLADAKAEASERRHALESLVAAGDAKLPPVLHALLDDPPLREPALLALASYDDPKTPDLVLARYQKFDLAARRAAVGTLAGRSDYAAKLIAAVRSGAVPAADLTAATARQLRDLGDPSVDAFVDSVWGVARTSPKEKTDLMAKYKTLLTDARVKAADASHGRAVFNRTCAQCHTLYGEGGAVGPDLTGSNRFNLDYVLQNVIDPSAVIAKEFQVTLIRTKDGRVVSGIAQEGDHSVKVVAETGKVVVPREEIDKIKRSDLSMMPDGLIHGLSDKDVADLVAYLRTTDQVPLPAGVEGNAQAR